MLYDNGEYEDALLIHIMWSLASRPNEMVTLRFEDFEDNDNQKSVLYNNCFDGLNKLFMKNL